MSNQMEFYRAVAELLEKGQRGAVATVLAASGSTPREKGAKLLYREDGTQVGTVGGGAIEHFVLEECRKAIASGTSIRLKKHLTKELGMCCGGGVEILIEPLHERPLLAIFGGGHVGMELAKLAVRSEFRVLLIDDREGCLKQAPDGVDFLEMGVEKAFRALPEHPAYLVITTYDHQMDQQALTMALHRQDHYVGMIGSVRKAKVTSDRIRARRRGLGENEPEFDRVYAPMGLDIGAQTPFEIALCTLAQIIAVRNRKGAGNLSIFGESESAAPAVAGADVRAGTE